MSREIAIEIAKQICDACADLPILESALERFDKLSNEDKRVVIEFMAGALASAEQSAGYSLKGAT